MPDYTFDIPESFPMIAGTGIDLASAIKAGSGALYLSGHGPVSSMDYAYSVAAFLEEICGAPVSQQEVELDCVPSPEYSVERVQNMLLAFQAG